MNRKAAQCSRIGAWTIALFVPLLAIAIVIIILIGGSSNTRSFLIEARTTGVEIKFAGLNNIWPLGRATICTPLDRPDRTGQRGDTLCDERLFELHTDDDLLLELSDKGEAFIGLSQDGGLEVRVSGILGFPDNTRILIDPQSWELAGALAFSGNVTIGGQMGSGQQKYLLGGRFEVREKPRIPYGRTGRIDVIKSGQLLRGEQISITTPAGPSAVVGHITPVSDASGGMNIVVVSLPGRTFLSLGHIGGDSVSLIEPDWIDHALASPILLALTFVLTVCIGTGQLLFDAVGFFTAAAKSNERKTPSDLGDGEDVSENADTVEGNLPEFDEAIDTTKT